MSSIPSIAIYSEKKKTPSYGVTIDNNTKSSDYLTLYPISSRNTRGLPVLWSIVVYIIPDVAGHRYTDNLT